MTGNLLRQRLFFLGVLLSMVPGFIYSSIAETHAAVEDMFAEDAAADVILDPVAAFRPSALRDGTGRVKLQWDITTGYYLYRNKFAVYLANEDLPVAEYLPAGVTKNDPVFGNVQVFYQRVDFDLPVTTMPQENAFALEVTYQGCKENAVCYPPQRARFQFTGGEQIVPGTPLDYFADNLPSSTVTAQNLPATDMNRMTTDEGDMSALDRIVQRIVSGSMLGTIFAFLGFGLLLSLTPCVYPMIPILAGVLVKQDEVVTPRRAFVLSATFVLAMASMYALLGVISASFHINIQGSAQTPWVVGTFSLIFVLLALSMFGLFHLQVPHFIQRHLHLAHERQQRDSMIGAAMMGALSALIVGPCITPPLAAALVYISQTGDALLGGSALFMMGIGFGIPLLIIGTSAGELLPRAGQWMNAVKHGFGVLMLAVAIWFLERVMPAQLTAALWGLLLIITALFMGALDRSGEKVGNWRRLYQGIGLAMLIYGGVMMFGAATGGGSLAEPLRGFYQRLTVADVSVAGRFTSQVATVRTLAELEEHLLQAREMQSPVVLDFYADWCVDCHRLERETFADNEVQKQFSQMVLLRADVTENDAGQRALLQRYSLFGPPAIVFYDRSGQLLGNNTVIGFVAADTFMRHLQLASVAQ